MTQSVEVHINSDINPLFERAKPTTELFSKALALYPYVKNETISHGKAAEILGIPKWDLIQIYGDFGFNYIDMDDEEWAQELAAVKRISEKCK